MDNYNTVQSTDQITKPALDIPALDNVNLMQGIVKSPFKQQMSISDPQTVSPELPALPYKEIQNFNFDPRSQLPDAPTPTISDKFSRPQPSFHNPDRLGEILGLTDFGTRMLDAYSTHRALQNPNTHEATLPKWIVNSTPALYGYSGLASLSNYVLSRELEKHGHPTLAHALQIGDIGYDLPMGIHNMTLPLKGPDNSPALPFPWKY